MTTNKENRLKFDVKSMIIVVLVIIIVILWFMLWKYSSNFKQINKENINVNSSGSINTNWEDIVMTVIDDSRCSECFTKEILTQLKLVPVLQKATIIEKDFSDEWVSKYLKENNITALPAIIFNTSNVETTINTYLAPLTSGEYSLALWSTFNPFAEICDNKIDDTWDWKIDCEDTTCISNPICRLEEKAKLDVFLMWFCPFWEIAANTIPTLKTTFWDKLNIDIHFIASKVKEWETAESFDSLHWAKEVEEDIRQLCIKKYNWINTLISYFWKRYKNADKYGAVKDEPSLAYTAVWINAKTIDTCISNWEWVKLLEEDIKLATELNIWASPTWLANNKYSFGWVEVSTIQTEFCKYNSELKWCNKAINNTASTTWVTPECSTK